jgi:ribonuclease VapC
MVVDTSAVMTILKQEPDARSYAEVIETAKVRLISAVSLLAGILAKSRKGDEGARELDTFLVAAELEVVSFDSEQAAVARDAFRRFGKGRHPANLNFGDCAVYALAATRAESLLLKGCDFSATDVLVAMPNR